MLILLVLMPPVPIRLLLLLTAILEIAVLPVSIAFPLNIESVLIMIPPVIIVVVHIVISRANGATSHRQGSYQRARNRKG